MAFTNMLTVEKRYEYLKTEPETDVVSEEAKVPPGLLKAEIVPSGDGEL